MVIMRVEVRLASMQDLNTLQTFLTKNGWNTIEFRLVGIKAAVLMQKGKRFFWFEEIILLVGDMEWK